MLSNFDVLEKYYPTMAKAAKQAEVDFRAGEFQHCARQLRAFLEIALYIFQKIDLTKDDKPQVKDLIKDVVKKACRGGFCNTVSHYSSRGIKPLTPNSKQTRKDEWSTSTRSTISRAPNHS